MKSYTVMGKAISAFRPKSSFEKLNTLIESISCLEEFHLTLNQKKEIWMENVATYGTGLYFIIGGFIYLFFFPNDQTTKILYTIGYALYPILLIMTKEFIGWFFKKRMRKALVKLNKLKSEKKEILESIMKMEPFRSFKDCLDKTEATDLKDVSLDKRKSRDNNVKRLHSGKNLLEKIFEFVIGEGSNSRYGLICGKCGHHNGLALEEEFEYIFFKCCSCSHFNPAKKMKPDPPKLILSQESSTCCYQKNGDETSSEGEIISTKVLMKPQIDYSSSSVMERVGKWQNILSSLSER